MVSMENPITNCLPCFFRTDRQCCHTFQLRPKRFAIEKKERLSEMVKVYYWFISNGDNFDAKQF